MTRPGAHNLGSAVLRRIARLMQLHHDTHPDRIGQRFGVTATYVRQVWGRFTLNEMAPCHEAIEALRPAPPERREDSAVSPADSPA
jgi:hypothetical protein